MLAKEASSAPAARARSPAPALVLAAVLALLAVSVRPSSARPSAESASTAAPVSEQKCLTAGCNRTVASLTRTMNLSADPCEDFYQFACGRYVEETPLPDKKETVSVVTALEDALSKQLRPLLEAPPRPEEPAAFHKAKALYQSCMNTTRLDELGVKPAKKLLAALGLETWPILEEDAWWDESRFDWQDFVGTFMELGLSTNFLFTYGMEIDISNTSRYTLRVGLPRFKLELGAMNEVTSMLYVREYHNQMTSTAKLFRGATTNHSRLLDEAVSVSTLEITMNLLAMSLEERHNVTTGLNSMPLAALQQAFPYVSWLNFTRRMLPAGANVTGEERVAVLDPKYMAGLGQLLPATSKRVLANYLVWRALLDDVLPFLHEKARLVVRNPEERWQTCVSFVRTSMYLATSAMYVRRHSSEDARNKTVELVHDVKAEMRRLLETVDWMDATTRQAALLKAERMRFNVAYPPELLNDTALDLQYDKLEVRPNYFLENALALEREDFARDMAKYGTDAKKHDWTFVPGMAAVVNAFFMHSDNSLSIPAGLMQGAFFQPDRPQYMNYGGIGFAIGHETSHAFDETGGQFDVNGLMANWWHQETKKLFDQKVGCIVGLYGAMRNPVVNVTVNGVLTQNENIADNAALKLAYRAYKRYAARHGAEPATVLTQPEQGGEEAEEAEQAVGKVRTVVLEPRQMFWVSFASLWCSKHTDKDLNFKLRADPHLPGFHRVNGAISNAEEFAADFQCPAGSPMNPVHKCHVW